MFKYALWSIALALLAGHWLPVPSVEAADAPTLSISQCALAGRQPSGDGVFRIPETVRLDPRVFDVTCFVTGSGSVDATAKVMLTKDGAAQKDLLGTAPMTFAAPAGGVTIPASRFLSAGSYQFEVTLATADGNALAQPYTFSVAVAVGDTYTTPEIAEANDAKEAEMARGENTVATEGFFGFNWIIVGSVLVVGILIFGLWFSLRRRSAA